MEVVEIAKRSAVVQWCLASSYLQHRVSVDDQWDHILPPGVFKCQISGELNQLTLICVSCISYFKIGQISDSQVAFATGRMATVPFGKWVNKKRLSCIISYLLTTTITIYIY